MVRIMFWLQLLLLVFLLKKSDAVSEQCWELQNEISRLEGHILKRIKELEYRDEILVSKYYVNILQYDLIMCSPILCVWLLYCSCFVTVIELCVA